MRLAIRVSRTRHFRATAASTLLTFGFGMASLVGAVGAHAQAAEGRAGNHAAEVQQRFKAADSNGDGKLSKEEAKAGMPMVYRHFDEIDIAKTGSITMADLAAFLKAQRAKKSE